MSWPLSDRALSRIKHAQEAKQREEKLALSNFQVRMTEIMEIGRPDDAPSEAIFDGEAAFCLPEFLPDSMKRALGIKVSTPDSPQPSTEEDGD